jgi:hypothetical protein
MIYAHTLGGHVWRIKAPDRRRLHGNIHTALSEDRAANMAEMARVVRKLEDMAEGPDGLRSVMRSAGVADHQ